MHFPRALSTTILGFMLFAGTACDDSTGKGTAPKDADNNMGSDTGVPSAFLPLEWTFDTGWDGFEHAFGDVSFSHDAASGSLVLDTVFARANEESSVGRLYSAADWRGATTIEIVVQTLDHMTGFWRVELQTGYAWSPCIVAFDHPSTTDWTTLTLSMDINCPNAFLEMTQSLAVGVVTGSDAASEHVQVAIDRITVK